jgi:hypothetical protein
MKEPKPIHIERNFEWDLIHSPEGNLGPRLDLIQYTEHSFITCSGFADYSYVGVAYQLLREHLLRLSGGDRTEDLTPQLSFI